MIILVCSWLRRVGNASQGVSIYFMIIVAWVACIEVLIKNWEQKTFLAWPVHVYANCLQLLVSAGPPKSLGHLQRVPWKSWKVDVSREQFWEKISIIVIPTLTTMCRSSTCTPIPAQLVLTNTWMLLQKMSVCLWNYLTFSDPLKKPAITLSLTSLLSSPPILAISALIPALHIWDSATQLWELNEFQKYKFTFSLGFLKEDFNIHF